MEFNFLKYQGTGNDFILIDNRNKVFNTLASEVVAKLCDRRFGIGADGLMLLQNKEGYDFEMIYYNSDGNLSSMCGNGGRCIVDFARRIGVIKDKAHFMAVDGEHNALIGPKWVSLKMNDVKKIEEGDGYFFLNTGSPHYVKFVNHLDAYPVFEEGRKTRYNERFKKQGTNVNFIEMQGDTLFVRTYERGVENETYSCGTGVTASALVASLKNIATGNDHCKIKTLGGDLNVKFKKEMDGSFSDIWLEGPATFVFEGKIEINK